MLKALVSIHDVMPSTMQDVSDLLEVCDRYAIANVTLLVVPGLAWEASQLDQLKAWQATGRELAGHGWIHRCSQIKSWTHWLHSRTLSRDVAEHLSLSKPEVLRLIERCAAWFPVNGLAAPELYVPPAWALGGLSSSDLRSLPFNQFESLLRLHYPKENRERLMPLVGFEADTTMRKFALRLLNATSLQISRASGRAVRIAIHPADHRLLLADSLHRILSGPIHSLVYRDASN